MYANRAIAEPTRAGKWWRKAAPDACSIIVTVYCGEDYMRWDYPSGGSRRVYREEGVTWTGPIPAPEDKPARENAQKNIMGSVRAAFYFQKPAPIEEIELKSGVPWIDALVTEHFKNTTPEERIRLMDEVEAKTTEDTRVFVRMVHDNAPSKDEAEKWGRALHAARPIRQKFPYDDMHSEDRKEWNAAGLRFHAKCVAPWKKVVDAAREAVRTQDSDEFFRLKYALDDLSALPDRGESAEALPPVSDEELGRNIGQFIVCHCKVMLIFTPTEWAEFGATIRAELAG